MSIEKVDYLIIGNGITGLSAAKAIRNYDKDGSITMVSKEPYYTYYRVKLTEYLSKTFINNEELLVNNEEWYRENQINVILNKIVEKIDFENNVIKLDDGILISYKKLLLATGSRPFIPPIAGKFKKGVFALRTLNDLKYIRNYFSKCEKITVIGGGLLGIEAAWSIKQLNKEVNIIQHSSHLLNKQLDGEISSKLEKKLRNLGFNIYLDSSAEEILGENKVSGIKLSSGKIIETDAVLVSSGVRSNLDLVINTDIEYNRGINVDKYLRTNIPNVYAAGDVAEVEGVVLGLWTAGNQQGKIVGSNMVGDMKEYISPKPYTKLEIGDIKIFSAGNVKKHKNIYEYKKDENIHHKLFTIDGKIVGGILFGEIKEMFKLRKAILENEYIENYLKETDIKFKKIN